MARTRHLLHSLAVAVLLVGGLAAYLLTRFEGPPKDTTAALVPADATLYASFFVDPSSDQKRLLRDRVEEAGNDVDAGSLVEDILDRVTRGYGLAYADIDPWIDRQMALFLAPRVGGAVVVEIHDEGAARDAMQRVGGRVLGDHAVFGDASAVGAAVQVFRAGTRASLVGPDSFLFGDAIDDVPDDRLALAMVTGSELSSRAVDLPSPLDAVELPVGMAQGNAIALGATETGLAFDGFSYSDGAALLLSGRDVPLTDLGTAGRDAWIAGIIPNLSVAADAIAREVRQTGRVSGARIPNFEPPAVLEPTDQALFWVGGDSLNSISAGLDVTTGGGDASGALARSLAGVPRLQPRFGFRRNGLVAEFGSETHGTLASDPRYRESVGWLDGLQPIGYIDVPAAGNVPQTLALIAGTQQGLAAGYALPPWLTDLDRVVVGLGQDAGPTHWRVVASLGR